MKTETEWQQLIASAKIGISNCEVVLREAKLTYENILIERYTQMNGLMVGDVVTWDEWSSKDKQQVTLKGRIIKFAVRFDRCTPVVGKFKKDGSMGALIRDYWNGTTQPVKV